MLEGNRGAYVPPDGGESVWLVGDLIEVRLSAEDTGGAYSMIEETTPPGGGPPPHLHANEDEAFCVLEGEVEFLLGEDTVPAGVGTCVHAPKGTLHTFRNVGTSPSRVLAVITPGGFEGFFLDVTRELLRVLKPTGSFYYHCDWHASRKLAARSESREEFAI